MNLQSYLKPVLTVLVVLVALHYVAPAAIKAHTGTA
jgi:hypothetical protein